MTAAEAKGITNNALGIYAADKQTAIDEINKQILACAQRGESELIIKIDGDGDTDFIINHFSRNAFNALKMGLNNHWTIKIGW